MQHRTIRLEARAVQVLVRNLGIWLIYITVVARSLMLSNEGIDLSHAARLLAAYGVLLAVSAGIERTQGRWQKALQIVYLVLQNAIVLGFRPTDFRQDIFPVLFMPLSLQAVLFFGARWGYAWIGVFSTLAALDVLMSWHWQLPGVAQALLFAGACVFTGRYGHLILKAEATHQHNHALADDLTATYAQLVDTAAKAEGYAIQQERSRMARELHDSATQTIFSMNLAAQAAQMLASRRPDQMVAQLERLQSLASGAVGEIQALSGQLRTPPPASGGLPSALRQLVTERQAQDGLEIDLEIAGQRTLDESVAACLYRIAQEGLNNIVKHAGTRKTTLRLRLDYPASLEIEDHGVGFEVNLAREQAGRFGLSGMAERVREINWHLSVDSAPGRGTRIRADETGGVPRLDEVPSVGSVPAVER